VSPPRLIRLADPRPLLAAARRTKIVRVGAGAGLLLLALVAILVSRHPHAHEARFLPQGSDGIVVLDLSASISTETYSRIGQTLDELSRTGGRYGVVVFSDAAYEALPPGTPASALKPLVRFFTLPKQERPGIAPTFPVNPWTDSFSAGTRISTGLDLARSILIRDKLARPAVLLVSDLDDAPRDLPNLYPVVKAYRDEGIQLNVVGLNPAPEDEHLFRSFVSGGNGGLSHARLPGEAGAATVTAPFPWALVLVALALIALLAANELVNARLSWRTREAAS
jgi:hypothetical protein